VGIQRADVLFPVNSTTVDSATGIDIRLLDSAQAGATDSDQSVRWTHTQDGTNRTFDPDNALVTTADNPQTFQGKGWALRLSEDHTPADDTNCNSILKAGTLSVQMRCLLNANGGSNLGGVNTISMRVALFKYNVSTNASGGLIATGSANQTWDTSALGGENNTRKNTTISVVVASDVEFLANEVLLLQLGANATTLVNATLGTTNYDLTLDVDDSGTFLDFASGQGIRIRCSLSDTTIGKGTVTLSRALTMSKSLVGKGVVTMTRLSTIAKTFSLIGKGVVTHTKAVAKDFDLVGRGTATMTRVVVAAKSFTLVGKGVVTLGGSLIAMARSAVGKGVVISAKATAAAKTFSLIGKGVVTEVHPVQAFRAFNLVGKGEILKTGANASTITLPIDEVPGEGGGETIIVKKYFSIFD
jgi:hypothetical protein